jgi:hypothetical protein
MENNFVIVPATYGQNTFFLFRDYSVEITFTIVNNIITVVGNSYLLPVETEFIKENYLQKLI